MEALYPVIILFVLFFLNIPIAFALMGSALFYFIFFKYNYVYGHGYTTIRNIS